MADFFFKMNTSTTTENLAPTTVKQRFIILDALRGFALLFIILANFPEFGLWTFLSEAEQQAMPSAGTDRIVRFLQYMLIDGKGYGLFSLLFGCGFSIFVNKAYYRGGHGLKLFLRRMFILLCFALIHILFIWSGDILCLYATMGMLLSLFYRRSNKALLWWAGMLLFLPVVIDYIQDFAGISIAAPLEDAWWRKANSYGITEENFATWLVDARSYTEVFQFLMQGAIERMWEFVDGDRFTKVLGLFILGFYLGKNRFYAHIPELKPHISKLCFYSGLLGIPTSLIYAWDSTTGHSLGEGFHSLIYFLSVVPMTFFYLTGFCLLWSRNQQGITYRLLALPGRMAFTNYIGQSVIGVLIYYGIGLGLGLSMGLAEIEITALLVFILQILFSACWLRYFRFGPLEWIWRMLTYGKWFSLRYEDTKP